VTNFRRLLPILGENGDFLKVMPGLFCVCTLTKCAFYLWFEMIEMALSQKY
jgi:hypothetical protein